MIWDILLGAERTVKEVVKDHKRRASDHSPPAPIPPAPSPTPEPLAPANSPPDVIEPNPPAPPIEPPVT